MDRLRALAAKLRKQQRTGRNGPHDLWIVFPHDDCPYGSDDLWYPQTPGIELFGVWGPNPPEANAFSDYPLAWAPTPVCYRARNYPDAHSWEKTVSIPTHIPQFPSPKDWPGRLEAALDYLVSKGAVAAWCGAWDLAGASPNLVEQSAKIYAAYSAETGFIGNTSLIEDKCESISQDDLQEIQRVIDQRIHP